MLFLQKTNVLITSPASSLLLARLLTVVSYSMGYPSGQFGSCLSVPSQSLAHPKLTALEDGDSLDAVPALLSSGQNGGVLPILFYVKTESIAL